MKKLALITITVILTNLNYIYGQTPATTRLNRQQILLTVQGFIKWYKANKPYLDTIRLIQGGAPDSTTRPSIDWDGVERFLAKIDRSGFVTPAYLNTHREYFKQIDKNLEGFKLTSELIKINGMDMDFVLRTHEPDEILQKLIKGNAKIFSANGKKAYVGYELYPNTGLLFDLSYHKKWKIEAINYDSLSEHVSSKAHRQQ